MSELSIKIDFEKQYKVIVRDQKGRNSNFLNQNILSFSKKYNSKNFRCFENCSFKITYLIERYHSYEQSENENEIKRYESYIQSLSANDFYTFIKELFLSNKITENSIKLKAFLIETNIKSGERDEKFLSDKCDKEADYLISEIIQKCKSKDLIDRFFYLMDIKEKFRLGTNYCFKLYPDSSYLIEILTPELKDYNEIFQNHYNPLLIQEKVLHYIKKFLSETAIKVQVQYGLQPFKLNQMLLTNNVILVENNLLLSASLSLIPFDDWKTIILNDIKILLTKDKYRILNNLKQQIKVAINEYNFRTSCSVFYERQYEVHNIDDMPITSVSQSLKWINSIVEKNLNKIDAKKLKGSHYLNKMDDRKLLLKDSINPNSLFKIVKYFFKETSVNPNINSNKSIKKFILETFKFHEKFSSFDDMELIFIHPKINFFPAEFKNEFRQLFMFLHNQDAFKNFSIYKASVLIEENFNLPEELKFGKSGHRDFFSNYWDAQKKEFTNISFEKLKISILKPMLTGN